MTQSLFFNHFSYLPEHRFIELHAAVQKQEDFTSAYGVDFLDTYVKVIQAIDAHADTDKERQPSLGSDAELAMYEHISAMNGSDRRAVAYAYWKPFEDGICSEKGFSEVYGAWLNDSPTGTDTVYYPFADGTSALTEEQMGYLAERYDLDNLTWDEYKRYLGDLTLFNALSADDYMEIVFFQPAHQELHDRLASEDALIASIADKDYWIEFIMPGDAFNLYDYLLDHYNRAKNVGYADNEAYARRIAALYERIIGLYKQTAL